MESFEQFKNRIFSFEKKELSLEIEDFSLMPKLSEKVSEDGSFKSFYGDTTVFDLDIKTKKKINSFVEKLYDGNLPFLAERIKESTFHITLHDLSSSVSLSTVAEECFLNEITLRKLTDGKRINKKIKFKTTFAFNMVNTSLVLGVVPKTEKDYISLMELYSVVDKVKSLPYCLTPHITLAYYRPVKTDKSEIEKLKLLVSEFNQDNFDIVVSKKNLYYQKFESMNDYTSVFSFTGL